MTRGVPNTHSTLQIVYELVMDPDKHNIEHNREKERRERINDEWICVSVINLLTSHLHCQVCLTIDQHIRSINVEVTLNPRLDVNVMLL